MTLDTAAETLSARVLGSFSELVDEHTGADAIGVDIPIGLSVGEPRLCDVEARRVLGRRRSSVFPAPDPRVIGARTYVEALELSRSLTGKGISRQSFAIFPKVTEVNREVTPALQDRVFEVHPEVSFWALAGKCPMEHSKKTQEGYLERRAWLASVLAGVQIPSRDDALHLAKPATPDDVLDAIVAAWTALRYAQGHAGRLPPNPPISTVGLRMEIVY